MTITQVLVGIAALCYVVFGLCFIGNQLEPNSTLISWGGNSVMSGVFIQLIAGLTGLWKNASK